MQFSASLLESSLPESVIYDISYVGDELPFTDTAVQKARCDFEDGGEWTVILRRKADVSQQVNFTRLWKSYEYGFGDLNTEFWYGLHNVHYLTTKEEVELQIKVKQDDGTGQVWTYGTFRVDGPENDYTLHIGQAEGPSNGYDSMTAYNGAKFGTYEVDNDHWSGGICGAYYKAGWWFKGCVDNGCVLTGPHDNNRLFWLNSQGTQTYFPYAEMKIRPKRCKPISDPESSCNN